MGLVPGEPTLRAVDTLTYIALHRGVTHCPLPGYEVTLQRRYHYWFTVLKGQSEAATR
jgi:hypothetical protein